MKKSSWQNVVDCIQASKIESKGSFWACIQAIEGKIAESKT